MISQTPLRILLIEDRTVTAISLECFLEDLGHSVVAVAATGRQALETLDKFAGAVDLVIYEAFLIGFPCLDVADRVEDLRIPALVTSNLHEDDLRVLGFDAAYLAQPFTDLSVARAISDVTDAADLTAA